MDARQFYFDKFPVPHQEMFDSKDEDAIIRIMEAYAAECVAEATKGLVEALQDSDAALSYWRGRLVDYDVHLRSEIDGYKEKNRAALAAAKVKHG